MMKEILNRKAGSRTRMLATALLASTLLAGGGFAWSEAGAATEAAPPLGLAPVVNQAGFADLVAKVRPAVVNIATTEAASRRRSRAPNPQQSLLPAELAVRPDVPPFLRSAGIAERRSPRMPWAPASSSIRPAIS